jgi:hypothetical protein
MERHDLSQKKVRDRPGFGASFTEAAEEENRDAPRYSHFQIAFYF